MEFINYLTVYEIPKLLQFVRQMSHFTIPANTLESLLSNMDYQGCSAHSIISV